MQFARKLHEQRLLSLQNVAGRPVIVVCMDRLIVGLNDPSFSEHNRDKKLSTGSILAARVEMSTLWTGVRDEVS